MFFKQIIFAECQQCRKNFNIHESPSMKFCRESCEDDFNYTENLKKGGLRAEIIKDEWSNFRSTFQKVTSQKRYKETK